MKGNLDITLKVFHSILILKSALAAARLFSFMQVEEGVKSKDMTDTSMERMP